MQAGGGNKTRIWRCNARCAYMLYGVKVGERALGYLEEAITLGLRMNCAIYMQPYCIDRMIVPFGFGVLDVTITIVSYCSVK